MSQRDFVTSKCSRSRNRHRHGLDYGAIHDAAQARAKVGVASAVIPRVWRQCRRVGKSAYDRVIRM